jgi:hypothetical protein
MPSKFLTAFFVLSLIGSPSFGQEDLVENTHGVTKVALTDGSELIGTVVGEDSTSIKFRTIGGVEVVLPKSSVSSIKPVAGNIVGDRFYKRDPNYSRLFFGPTARALERGHGYFADYWLFFTFLGVGVGQGVTLAGGTTIFPSAEGQIAYLAPKVTFLSDGSTNLAAGAIHFIPLGVGDEDPGVGIAYIVGTLGNPDNAVTGGAGWGYAGDDMADQPVLIAAWEKRISNSFKFMTEAWFPPGAEGIVAFGFRAFGEKIAGDFALIHPINADFDGGFPFVPWLGIAYNFER